MPLYTNREYMNLMRPLPSFVPRDIYEIPYISNDNIDISRLKNGKWLINLNNISSKDKNASNKIVHSFSFDNKLNQKFNNMLKFVADTRNYYAISSFDFSMFPGMPLPLIIAATYNNRWAGAFLQCHGRPVIPCVGWVGKEHFDITFAGLVDGGVFLISSIGTHNIAARDMFLAGYFELRQRFPNTQIICVGNPHHEMDSDVCYIPFKESFGSMDKYPDFVWQPQLFNWDYSIATEVV